MCHSARWLTNTDFQLALGGSFVQRSKVPVVSRIGISLGMHQHSDNISMAKWWGIVKGNKSTCIHNRELPWSVKLLLSAHEPESAKVCLRHWREELKKTNNWFSLILMIAGKFLLIFEQNLILVKFEIKAYFCWSYFTYYQDDDLRGQFRKIIPHHEEQCVPWPTPWQTHHWRW